MLGKKKIFSKYSHTYSEHKIKVFFIRLIIFIHFTKIIFCLFRVTRTLYFIQSRSFIELHSYFKMY